MGHKWAQFEGGVGHLVKRTTHIYSSKIKIREGTNRLFHYTRTADRLNSDYRRRWRETVLDISRRFSIFDDTCLLFIILVQSMLNLDLSACEIVFRDLTVVVVS